MIEIDGSAGEGGGQILRSALALSMATGEPFRIRRIRAGRSKPGLLRQHLTCVQAAMAICAGKATGAALGSTELTFTPGLVQGGDHQLAIGSAGSTSLVLQTVLPVLITAPERSRIELSGGTHNPHAPTACFLTRCFLPLLARMGASAHLELVRHGFYPAGGGIVRLNVDPAPALTPIELITPGPIIRRRAEALISELPSSIAERELAVVAAQLDWSDGELQHRHLGREAGPGNVLTLTIEREHLTEVFTGFGERGLSAEKVAERLCADVRAYLHADVPVWQHLADQLLLPMALAGGGTFVTGPLTPHALTNIDVIEEFLEVGVFCEATGDDRWMVRVTKRPA